MRTATKQYALTLRTETIIRRKIAILAKLDHNVIIEAEVDEIPGICTVAFVPNDPKLLNLDDESSSIPQLTLMWRYRSFNLLLNQQSELHLFSIELTLLDSDDPNQPIIQYSSAGNIPIIHRRTHNGTLALVRNQWHKFEGKFVKSK